MLVGIDLGTSNSCLAWGETEGKVHLFEVPQLQSGGTRGKSSLLPSVLYAPIAGESFVDPFCDPPWITGDLARDRGLEVPGRTVTSAKSWLCHLATDPLAPALPYGADESVPRISAVDASARYLAHLVRAWDAAHPDEPLSQADIALTVPASFDERARALTLEAARRARLGGANAANVRLVEEPQAAFYDYLRFTRDETLRALANRHGGEAVVLVVDVGGGTTDLSLIAVRRSDKRKDEGVAFERIATGDHLLLGGDNMDLALAEHLRPLFRRDDMTPARFAQLVERCRNAKEVLLGVEPPADVPVALVTRGAKLVGSAETVRLTRADIERVLLAGFFPQVALEPRGRDEGRSGLVSLGLPYARDVAITRHIATFMCAYGKGRAPDALLFNGGVFRAEALRDAVVRAVQAWASDPIDLLKERDPDLAVAKGAVAYLRARRGVGQRVASGAARSYYVAMHAEGQARPGVCVVPYGSPEGQECVVKKETFHLVVGKAARFELWRAEGKYADDVGDIVELDDKRFARMPPLVAELEGTEALVDVKLSAELSAVGTIDVFCTEVKTKRKHRFAFELQKRVGSSQMQAAAPKSIMPPSMGGRASVVPGAVSSKIGESIALVELAFGSKEPRAVKDLVRDLEQRLGERFKWTIADVRTMFDTVAKCRGARRLTADHERVFWLLAGFTLRPGFGTPEDNARVEGIYPLFSQKLSFPDKTQNWQAFFIAWRRIAAGLGQGAHDAMFDMLAPMLYPELGSGKKQKQDTLATEELRELLSCLERARGESRAKLGEKLCELVVLQACTGKLGRAAVDFARVAARNTVTGASPLGKGHVEPWVDRIARLDWSKSPTLCEPMVRVCRVTTDASTTLGADLRERVAKRLEVAGRPAHDAQCVREFVALTDEEEALAVGEALPVGLRLRA